MGAFSVVDSGSSEACSTAVLLSGYFCGSCSSSRFWLLTAITANTKATFWARFPQERREVR